MIDDELVIPFDPPDSDIVWEPHVETCRRAGIAPVSRERASDLIAAWSALFAAASPTLH